MSSTSIGFQASDGVDIYGGSPSTGDVAAIGNSTEPAGSAAETASEASAGIHDRGLLLIGVFKLTKSLFFFCLGIGAFRLLHRDLTDEVMKLATALRFDPEGRLVGMLLEQVDRIDAQRLREIGLATFAYSAIALTEGYGLMLEKVWAEYLTLTLTISFLPWELFELIRRPNWGRLALLLMNLAVLGYLVWLLQRKKQKKAAAA